ncbi:L-2-amino-thiazoline-4-carboxylic acid hydrolase [Thermodesulfobacteriota bacterium]
MAIEDTYNGATAAMTFMNAYIKTVAEEIGMDKALGLLTKMCESMGTMQGKILKEQAGAEELDVKATWSLVKSVPVGIGIGAEVIKESQQEIVIKAGKCPLYSAGQMLGFDNQTMETMCRKGSARLMDTMTKELNPNLRYELRKFRSGADDFCEEAIIQG